MSIQDVVFDLDISQTASAEYTDPFLTETDEGGAASVDVLVDIDTEVGTASLVITPQVSVDGQNWEDRAALPAITAVGQLQARIGRPLAYVRLKLQLSGSSSPAFTGSIKLTPSDKQDLSSEGVITGQDTITAGGTAQPISTDTSRVTSVVIIADEGNAGALYVGDDTVDSATGLVLQPGKSIAFPIDYLTRIYVDGTTDDAFSFLASK